jgi:hypothetical protein
MKSKIRWAAVGEAVARLYRPACSTYLDGPAARQEFGRRLTLNLAKVQGVRDIWVAHVDLSCISIHAFAPSG